MWELPSDRYFLTAVYSKNLFPRDRDNTYKKPQMIEKTLPLFEGSVAQVEPNCPAGGVLFFAVGDRGYLSHIVLVEMVDEEGRNYIRDGLRSAGPAHSQMDYKECR
jgi:hypothetical protein